MYKRILATSVAILAVGGATLVATPAEAASNAPCITRPEFNRIHNGMSLTQVRNIVGSVGTVNLSSPPLVIRGFKTCAPYHVSNVSFMSGRVSGKLYI